MNIQPKHQPLEQVLISYDTFQQADWESRSTILAKEFCDFCLKEFASKPQFYQDNEKELVLVCSKWLLTKAKVTFTQEEITVQFTLQRSMNIIAMLKAASEERMKGEKKNGK